MNLNSHNNILIIPIRLFTLLASFVWIHSPHYLSVYSRSEQESIQIEQKDLYTQESQKHQEPIFENAIAHISNTTPAPIVTNPVPLTVTPAMDSIKQETANQQVNEQEKTTTTVTIEAPIKKEVEVVKPVVQGAQPPPDIWTRFAQIFGRSSFTENISSRVATIRGTSYVFKKLPTTSAVMVQEETKAEIPSIEEQPAVEIPSPTSTPEPQPTEQPTPLIEPTAVVTSTVTPTAEPTLTATITPSEPIQPTVIAEVVTPTITINPTTTITPTISEVLLPSPAKVVPAAQEK